MSVNPGLEDKVLSKKTYDKVKKLKKLIQDNNAQTLIEIDGGVNDQNAKMLIDAGARRFSSW